MTGMDDQEARQQVALVERLLDGLERLDAPAAGAALDAVQAVVELYGEGLRRIVAGAPLPEPVARDELVSHLLLLHELHPDDVESRVRGALDVLPALPIGGDQSNAVRATGTDAGAAARKFAPGFAPATDNRGQTLSFPDKTNSGGLMSKAKEMLAVSGCPVNAKDPLTIAVNGSVAVGATGFEPVTPSVSRPQNPQAA